MVYLPPAFTETRPEILIGHIERHDFGLLVTNGAAGLIASHIPFLVEQRDDTVVLQGHLARPNPQGRDLTGGEALVVFGGPHAYISPGWYAAAGPSVPTWNYTDVHAYGTPRLIDDPMWLREALRRLSERHEAREATPWRMQDLPVPYIDGMLKGIIGFEIAVTRLEGKFKLSQNRPAVDRPRVIDALERRGDADAAGVAALMREREVAG